jgi:hypothetical protein
MAKNPMPHVRKEYLFLILGFILSLTLNIIDFTINRKINEGGSNYIGYSYAITVSYFISTGYFLSFIAPIVGKNKKNCYRFIFFIFLIFSLLWAILIAYGGGGYIVLYIMKISICMPISYIFAWRVNSEYWRSKQS